MFDYFYGQSGEMFSYFRVPKILFRDIKFKDLSTDAKTLYGILLDRMGLSAKNGWLDGQGESVYHFSHTGGYGCAWLCRQQGNEALS